MNEAKPFTRGQWFVLAGAFLGWAFDGLEMGLFPLVARPALQDLLHTTDDGEIARWNSIIVASFLVGAALGGVLFGWLGDKIGRVRTMVFSVLTYSLCTGICYFATSAWQLGVFRFAAALGMGGEWSLAVALVMESWPERHRPALAGVIGSASNVGFLLIALVALTRQVTQSDWRWMMLVGAVPALLALLIRIGLPESERWQKASRTGGRSPLIEIFRPGLLGKTLLAVVFAAIPLIGTWAAVAGWTPLWADQLSQEKLAKGLLPAHATAAFEKASNPRERQAVLSNALRAEQWQEVQRGAAGAKAHVQIVYALCNILGCLLAPILCNVYGRRWAYFWLCLLSLLFGGVLYLFCTAYNIWFMVAFGLLATAAGAFYGWLPLYLPELFPTRIRATGQGLAFNAGRVVAAGGSLFMGQFVTLFDNHYGHAAAAICSVYAVGMVLIWLAPETSGRPLPE